MIYVSGFPNYLGSRTATYIRTDSFSALLVSVDTKKPN